MIRNMLWSILILSFLILGFASCSQINATNRPQPVLISENGIQSIGIREILSAIDNTNNNDEIKGILKNRAEILLHYVNKLNLKCENINEKVDEHLYVSGIRSGIGFTDLFIIAKDTRANYYRVIVRKQDQKILLTVAG